MHRFTQGLRCVARPAHNNELFGRAVLHRLGQHIPARQNTAAKQHHHIGLRAAVCLAHCRLCQGRQVPFSTKAAQFVDILRRLFQHGLHSFLL